MVGKEYKGWRASWTNSYSFQIHHESAADYITTIYDDGEIPYRHLAADQFRIRRIDPGADILDLLENLCPWPKETYQKWLDRIVVSRLLLPDSAT